MRNGEQRQRLLSEDMLFTSQAHRLSQRKLSLNTRREMS
jgi:hypothetical protein